MTDYWKFVMWRKMCPIYDVLSHFMLVVAKSWCTQFCRDNCFVGIYVPRITPRGEKITNMRYASLYVYILPQIATKQNYLNCALNSREGDEISNWFRISPLLNTGFPYSTYCTVCGKEGCMWLYVDSNWNTEQLPYSTLQNARRVTRRVVVCGC